MEQGTPKSESRIPVRLFEPMARWYFGGSIEREPLGTATGEVTISDTWLGVLCLSYYGNGPRHSSVGTSGGTLATGGSELPARDVLMKYNQTKPKVSMVPGGFAARKVTDGNRLPKTDQRPDSPSEDH